MIVVVLLALLVMAALVVGVVVSSRWSATTIANDSGTSSSRTPTLGTARPLPKASAIAPRTDPHTSAFARALAAVGAYDDGRRASLDDLPTELQAVIEPARALLKTTPRIAAPGLPMVLRDGTVAGIAPDPTPRSPIAAPETWADATPTPAERERARAVDGRLVARSLTTAGKAPPPTRGDRVKEILEPDAWMAVPYDPSLTAGEPLVLNNRSLGDYVLRLDADDYGSVRLNGGLVVPGRFYLMQGTMTISGDVPVGVVIRPLGVVHGYYEQPVRLPSANG